MFLCVLFQVYSSANFFELSLDSVCFCLFNAFLNIGRSVVNQFFGFFQSKTGDLSYSLDNLDLFSSGCFQNYGEFALFFSSSSSACYSACYGYRSGSGYAEFFFTSVN